MANIMEHRKSLIFQLLILIYLIFIISSCKSLESSGKVDLDSVISPDKSSVVNEILPPPQFLPLKIKWITPLFGEKRDTFNPVENGAPTIDGSQVFVGSNIGYLFCLDRASGEIVWKFKAFGGIESAPAIFKNSVLFGDSDGNIYSLNRANGMANWSFKVQGEVMGRITIFNEKILFTTTYNRIYALDANDGKWIWTHKRALPEGFSIRGVSSPVTDGKLVFAGLADGYLVAVDINRGREIWKNPIVSSPDGFLDVDATPVIEGEKLFVSGYGGALFCLNKNDGNIHWKFGRGGISKVKLAANRIFMSTSDGFVFAIDKKDGKKIWSLDIRDEDARKSATPKFRLKLRIPTSPVLFNNFLVTASSSGFLYAIDTLSGKILWRYFPGYGISSELVKESDGIYFLTNSAMIFKMEPNRFRPSLI